MLRIVVFQQNGRGESKIKGIREFGEGLFALETISIDTPLPSVLDDADEYLSPDFEADLVLDYLKHPDLSHDLAVLCRNKGIPVVASGKKHHVEGTLTPPICCALSKHTCLGAYGDRFGAPAFAVEVADGKILNVTVLRGAPCGATWEAAARMVGLPLEEAAVRIGLETQFFCTADPSGWDPMYGKSPVHFAAELHRAAFSKALHLSSLTLIEAEASRSTAVCG